MRKYVIITPARNEAAYIEHTLDTVAAQTVAPAQWIIVDDGSTDDTARIVESYKQKHQWLKLVSSPTEREARAGGEKVVRAFYAGYHRLDVLDYDIIVKLDADLTLPPQYFQKVVSAFETEKDIGLCGGYLSEFSNGAWKRKRAASYHLAGPIKAYRRECFDQIGGIPMTRRWDSIDEMTAMSLGWRVRILPVEVRHHRRMSTLINRGLESSFVKGQQHYKDGYDMFLAFCRSVTYGYMTKPYVLSSVAFLFGFAFSCLARPDKDVSPDLQAFIRRFQYSRIRNILIGRLPKLKQTE